MLKLYESSRRQVLRRSPADSKTISHPKPANTNIIHQSVKIKVKIYIHCENQGVFRGGVVVSGVPLLTHSRSELLKAMQIPFIRR